jgi:hypothetical protein
VTTLLRKKGKQTGFGEWVIREIRDETRLSDPAFRTRGDRKSPLSDSVVRRRGKDKALSYSEIRKESAEKSSHRTRN